MRLPPVVLAVNRRSEQLQRRALEVETLRSGRLVICDCGTRPETFESPFCNDVVVFSLGNRNMGFAVHEATGRARSDGVGGSAGVTLGCEILGTG